MSDRQQVAEKRSKMAVTTRSLETPIHRDLWRGAADLEKAHGSHESFDKQLARAVELCLQTEVLWLMWAKEKCLGGDVRAGVRNSEGKQI